MRALELPMRAVLALMALYATQLLAGLTVPVEVAAPAPAWTGLVTQALVALALTLAAWRAPWRGWRLGLALSGMAYAVEAVNLVEGAAFLTNVGLQPWRLLALFALAYALAIPAWMLLFRRRPAVEAAPAATHRPRGAPWRLAACALLYVVLYFGAGTIAYPFVRDFYAGQRLPPFPQLVALQLLFRGPVYVGVVLLLVRMVRLPRRAGLAAAAGVFVLLTAIAPLAAPSPFFPDAVRLVHLGEVAVSNLVFAILAGWIWMAPTPRANALPAPSVSPVA